MTTADFDAWRAELLSTGAIVQDADESVLWPERERRFNRYLELLEAVAGTEGLEAACTLIQSMQAREDYGAYQSTQRVLGRFPSVIYVAALIRELPSLISRQPDWAGELACSLANSVGTPSEPDISEFRRQLAGAERDQRTPIRRFLEQQERDGWLSHRPGVLSNGGAG
jgi:hypothetical protein